MRKSPPVLKGRAPQVRSALRRQVAQLEAQLSSARMELQTPRGGFVEVIERLPEGERTVCQLMDAGSNRLTDAMRVIAAKLMARKAVDVAPATFPLGIEGYDADDPVFPAFLYIGTSPTPAQRTDTRLETFLTTTETYPDALATPLRFTLARVLVRDSVDDYTDVGQSINVTFEFDIPVGTLRSGGDAETSPLLIREFGLYTDTQAGGDDYPIEGNPSSSADPQVDTGNPPIMLARRAADVIKLFEGSYTIRWRIWT